MNSNRLKENVLEIYNEALKAADPITCVKDHVNIDGNTFHVDTRKYNLDQFGSIFVIAFGKAASAMAKAIEDMLGKRINDGIVVSLHLKSSFQK